MNYINYRDIIHFFQGLLYMAFLTKYRYGTVNKINLIDNKEVPILVVFYYLKYPLIFPPYFSL